MRNLLSANQVAVRLGVQLKTVYAYVSRGVLRRTLADDGRTSLFDAAEVDALARRGRPRKDSRRLGGVDVSLATSITSIQSDKLAYRGHDVRTLVDKPFEAVAELLWTGSLPASCSWPFTTLRALTVLSASLPTESPAIERFAVLTAALACRQPLRVDLRPATVVQHARTLLNTLVDGLPQCGPTPHARATKAPLSLAARLWPRVSRLAPSSARIKCLNAALVLLADHELATSTFAARVAASTRADPFAVVLAGLGAVSGPLHGKAALGAHELLLAARSAASPERAVADVFRRGAQVPGFGHPVYAGADPRAQCIFAELEPLERRADRQLIDAVRAAASASSRAEPNVDFALACLAFSLDMPLGASEAIFALARIAGWVAHALEEYGEEPLRFRARALYIGAPAPA